MYLSPRKPWLSYFIFYIDDISHKYTLIIKVNVYFMLTSLKGAHCFKFAGIYVDVYWREALNMYYVTSIFALEYTFDLSATSTPPNLK